MNLQQALFTNTLRDWRKQRKISQLELSLIANVSQRHISWLETGRSRPSREMVINLSEALDIPLRERNHFLNSAGFADVYSHHKLDEPSMTPVTTIVKAMLDHHEPYPAYAVDRYWNIKMQNKASKLMFNITGEGDKIWEDIGDNGERNIALLTLHPNGLRNYIQNWHEIAGPFIKRLSKEAFESNDSGLIEHVKSLKDLVLPSELTLMNLDQELLPILPIIFGSKDASLSFYSVISTFGTAQDITANELRIESLYPCDKQTANFFSE